MDLSSYTMMTKLVPSFKRFLDDPVGVSTGTYDFIVPIETKGATLFDSLYEPREDLLFKSHVYYPRAFDFLPLHKVSGSRAAAIDDTLLSGRTLQSVKRELEGRGAMVDTFAFAKDSRTRSRRDRDKRIYKNTKAAIHLKDDASYGQYLMELRDWFTQTRIPAAYDHIVLRISNITRERFSIFLGNVGKVANLMRYGIRSGKEAWAVMPADEWFWLNDYASIRAAVPPKVRLWYEVDRQVLSVVPMWAPEAPTDFASSYSPIIISSISDNKVVLRNSLDAQSLTGRSRLLQALRPFLPELEGCRLERRHLDRTYTEPIADAIERKVFEFLQNNTTEKSSASADSLGAVTYWTAAKKILDRVRGAYEKQAAPRFARESRGYTIQQLIDEAIADRFTTHAAVDFLIDGGYLTSFYGVNANVPFTRGVRGTEIDDPPPVEKIIATYASLADDHHVSATEAQKLLPVLRNCFGRELDGIAIASGIGGLVTYVLYGEEDKQDITEVLEQSALLVKRGNKNARKYSYRQKRNYEELIGDPQIERLYGQISAIASIVHNSESKLTPSERSVLVSTLASERCGLELVARDAGAMTQAFGSAHAKLRSKPIPMFESAPNTGVHRSVGIGDERRNMGRAHSEAQKKIALLGQAADLVADGNHPIDLYQQKLLSSLKPPKRWTYLLKLWAWYLDAQYKSCLCVLARATGAMSPQQCGDVLLKIWTGSFSIAEPHEMGLRVIGKHWRQALSGHGIINSPTDLNTKISSGAHWFAHYDLAASSKQINDRGAWFAGSANVIHDWANLFGCGASSTRETQAESGFIWSDKFEHILHASVWSTYMLYVLSELQHPEAEWIPIFCICYDDPQENSVGKKMAGAAKVTKGISRVDAEIVAQTIRDYNRESLRYRLFVIGDSAIRECTRLYPNAAKDCTSYGANHNISEPLAMIDMEEILTKFTTQVLPKVVTDGVKKRNTHKERQK